MLVDHHCHLDFPDFAAECDAIVARAVAAGVGGMVTISTHIRRFPELLAIAQAYDNVYCSVGTHPHYAHTELDIPVSEIVALSRHPKVVAIGEAGLDYFYDKSPREAQAQGFRNHIAAAQETGLPLVIHAREADADTAEMLEAAMARRHFKAVLHCYTGGAELARRALALGLCVSFSGILTFKKSDDLRAVAASAADGVMVYLWADYLEQRLANPDAVPEPVHAGGDQRAGGMHGQAVKVDRVRLGRQLVLARHVPYAKHMLRTRFGDDLLAVGRECEPEGEDVGGVARLPGDADGERQVPVAAEAGFGLRAERGCLPALSVPGHQADGAGVSRRRFGGGLVAWLN